MLNIPRPTLGYGCSIFASRLRRPTWIVQKNYYITSRTQLKERLQEDWRKVPVDFCRNLVSLKPLRLRSVFRAQDWYLKYWCTPFLLPRRNLSRHVPLNELFSILVWTQVVWKFEESRRWRRSNLVGETKTEWPTGNIALTLDYYLWCRLDKGR